MTPEVHARPDETQTVDGGSIQHYPQVGLENLYDNRMRPSEVTIVDREARSVSTNWITIDIGHAVPIEECL